jgi:hypothetical protein
VKELRFSEPERVQEEISHHALLYLRNQQSKWRVNDGLGEFDETELDLSYKQEGKEEE